MLYFHWPLGLLLDGDQLYFSVKALSIIFDLAIGVVLFRIGRRFAGPVIGLDCAALFLFNPAVLVAGPIWGQLDSAGTLVILLCLLATDARRFGLAGALAVLALLTKPQFGLVLLPVLVVAFAEPGAGGRIRNLARVTVGGLATAVLVLVPLRLTPTHYWDMIGDTLAGKSVTSAYAFNPWGLLLQFNRPDGDLVYLGAALLLLGLAATLIPLRRRRDLPTLLTVCVFLVFAFYFLPTRVHERYLYPTMALLAPLIFAAGAERYRARLIGYAVSSLAFAAGLVYVLLRTTNFSLPDPFPELWRMGVTRNLLFVIIMGSAIWWIWELSRHPGRRDPSAAEGG
jgi:Gpi18-like mannosyltransferase